ncbi:hypothetical protein D0Z70_21745 [Sphingobium terrigena]|uniref:Lipoprotein n=1 Tax=Sphingobium terrigena TaxID=2304063 RepID=A0A418YLT3_9SPHN|nr:hypothetical protein [Sphingobium terrigena]RJG52076.1 hypothetical protein D0Z70_21745 [Sphingobium terrigena]
MRLVLALLPLIALAACDKPAEKPEVQPNVVANISDRTEPVPDKPQPVNATVPTQSPVPEKQASGPIPAALQGRWTGVSDQCGDRMADLELNILPDQMVFHESVGMVEAVTPDADGQLSVKAAFTGEGQSWTRTLVLRPAADGATLTIINDGTAVTRKRC